MNIYRIITLCGLSATLTAQAQTPRIFQDVEYRVEGNVVGATCENAPLWLSANRHGLSSIENTSGYLRGTIERDIESDTLRNWRFGYGADFVLPYNFTSDYVIHQLYAEAQYRKFRLSVGSKEQPQLFKDDNLSLGGMTISTNARPVPQVRGELAEWWNITRHANILAIRGHLSYGLLTDGQWQERFVGGEESRHLFAKNVLYHSKAGFMRIGNEQRFPLTATLGLEMVGIFGGEVWNLGDRGGTGNENFQSHQQLNHGVRDFIDALIPGGSDVNDGAFANVAGNQLGSWTISLDWNTPQWGVRAYVDHYFEDHSMMFIQYGWRDNLIGLEARLPRNRFVSKIVYENLNTTDQSGSVYHDATNVLPIQISGKDTYYNHHIYGAYHHWGQVMGNPMILGPIYNKDKRILTYNNRVYANHVALCGNPTDDISWRALCTFHHALGTYDVYINDARSVFLMAEANYAPHQLKGWDFSVGIGANTGDLLGNTFGMQATVRKTGLIRRRQK